MKQYELTPETVENLRDRLVQLQMNNKLNNKTLLDEELLAYIEQRLQKVLDIGSNRKTDDSGSADGSSVSSRITQPHRVKMKISLKLYIFFFLNLIKTFELTQSNQIVLELIRTRIIRVKMDWIFIKFYWYGNLFLLHTNNNININLSSFISLF